jgi:hypothetical protein
MERLLFILSSGLVLTTLAVNTCCKLSSNRITDSQFQDCLLEELSIPLTRELDENGDSISVYHSYYDLKKISSLPIDMKLNYLTSLYFNRQQDHFGTFIFLDSWLVDFSAFDNESKRSQQNFLILVKPQSIILHYSDQLSSLISQDSWNLMLSDELIIFRANYWTINLLTSWRKHVGKETQLDYLSFMTFYHSHSLSPHHESIFPSDQLSMNSVVYLNSSLVFQSSHTSITSLQDSSLGPLFLVGNLSRIDSFEMSLLVPHIWRSVCLGSRAEIVDSFISYEKKVPYEISDALSRLFDSCKTATSSNQVQ